MRKLPETSAAEFEQTLLRELRQVCLTVFLCGASISRDERPRWNQRNARVRHEIMERLEDEGCKVVLGEDKAFYTAARAVLAENHNLVNQELALTKHAHLTVIFPCSAGSFAEVGMFALLPHVGSRLVIVVDDRDGFEEGYIAKGPVLMAEKNDAQVAFIPYDNIDEVWRFVSKAVDRAREREWRSEIFVQR